MSQNETSESGDRVYHHKARKELWVLPNTADSNLVEIDAHIEKHIGKVEMVYHELISDLVHIDVHQIPPSESRPFWTLVTTGMSDLPMTTPEGREEYSYAELMICLPEDWKMGKEHWKDEANYWPIRILKACARFPHEYKTWLCRGHSLPLFGDPNKLAKIIPFTSLVLGTPKTVARDFLELPIRDNKIIRFFVLYPIYEGELALKLKNGYSQLEELFDKNGITELLDIKRMDVSAKSKWQFWK